MTGFGRAVQDTPFGRITVEIHSVNRKYFEMFISSPKEFGRFEHDVRKQVGDSMTRGQISVRIYFAPNLSTIVLPDPKVLKDLKLSWEQLAKHIGTDPKEISLPFLMQYLPPDTKETSDELKDALQSCVKEAIVSIQAMKKTEGQTLSADLSERVKELERMIAEVAEHAPDATKKMRAKLFEKMEEAHQQGPQVDERLLREVAIFAEKVDITEEITRFRSHIDQFKTLLKGDVVGRKMDFLLQEMGREINTIGSKSLEAKISHTVVAMKSELEKIREQVQNIE